MKKFITGVGVSALLLASLPLFAADGETLPGSPKVGIVRFKDCAETSQVGKAEQQNFDKFKNNFQTTLGEKQAELQKMQGQIEDPDYLDSLSPEAERELRQNMRRLAGEFQQMQQYFMQSAQQANYHSLQTISGSVADSAEVIAERLGLDLVINAESCFYLSPKYDVTEQIIVDMDKQYAAKPKTTSATSETSELQMPETTGAQG
jgi:outer membrane protein